MTPDAPSQILLCTCPDAETGAAIARTLVDEGLAACVNVVPAVTSVYRWQGSTQTAEECLLLVKGASARYAQIENRIIALHPYELPEIIAVPVTQGLPRYLAWLNNPEG